MPSSGSHGYCMHEVPLHAGKASIHKQEIKPWKKKLNLHVHYKDDGGGMGALGSKKEDQESCNVSVQREPFKAKRWSVVGR